MTANSRYIIASVVTGEIAKLHQKLVGEVSQKFNLRKIKTPSHITLKDNFYCEDTSEVEKVIEEAINEVQIAGNILINGISSFRNEIFYIDAKLDDNSRKIYENLIRKLTEIEWLQWDQFDTLERQFHLTITNKATSENFVEIKEYLEQFHPLFQLPFDNISILKKLENEHRWIIHKEFRF